MAGVDRGNRRGGRLNLTYRERQVFCGVVAGRSSKEIADDLGLSHRTVEVWRTRINQQLGARSSADVLRKAGLVKPTAPTSAEDAWWNE